MVLRPNPCVFVAIHASLQSAFVTTNTSVVTSHSYYHHHLDDVTKTTGHRCDKSDDFDWSQVKQFVTTR